MSNVGEAGLTGFIGEIVARKPGKVVVKVAATGCGSACGCGRAARTMLELPSCEGERIRLSMTPRDLYVLLANTLLLPLVGFLLGAVLGQAVFENDWLALGGALVGFGVGMSLCRGQSLERVVIEEVSTDE